MEEKQVELKETVVAINRVAKVVKGGRTFRFSAVVVVGDEQGHIGVGNGKAAEVPDAIKKAIEEAKKEFETDDIEKLRTAIEKLSKENEAIVTKLYQNAASKAQAEQTETKKEDDEVIVEDPKDKDNK